MKPCFVCKEEKPLAEYYKNKGMTDGHVNKCKPCTRQSVMKHRAENLEKIRAYDRGRGCRQTPEYLREYRRKNPEKARAHSLVAKKLTNPRVCSQCPSTFHIEAHHDDYSKPLEVRWLCAACHKQHHANEKF